MTGGRGMPRLADLLEGWENAWVLSCMRMNAVEIQPDGKVVSHTNYAAHDWFTAVDLQLSTWPVAVQTGLDPANWYDLAGSNGCPVEAPAPSSVPLVCADSILSINGSPSVHGADYDGATSLFLSVGSNRMLINESVGGPVAFHSAGHDSYWVHRNDWNTSNIQATVWLNCGFAGTFSWVQTN